MAMPVKMFFAPSFFFELMNLCDPYYLILKGFFSLCAKGDQLFQWVVKILIRTITLDPSITICFSLWKANRDDQMRIKEVSYEDTGSIAIGILFRNISTPI